MFRFPWFVSFLYFDIRRETTAPNVFLNYVAPPLKRISGWARVCHYISLLFVIESAVGLHLSLPWLNTISIYVL